MVVIPWYSLLYLNITRCGLKVTVVIIAVLLHKTVNDLPEILLVTLQVMAEMPLMA
jgi:hypothetical protein